MRFRERFDLAESPVESEHASFAGAAASKLRRLDDEIPRLSEIAEELRRESMMQRHQLDEMRRALALVRSEVAALRRAHSSVALDHGATRQLQQWRRG